MAELWRMSRVTWDALLGASGSIQKMVRARVALCRMEPVTWAAMLKGRQQGSRWLCSGFVVAS